MELQEVEWSNQIIDTTVMNIYIANNGVEFEPSANTFKENLYKGGGGVLTLGAPLLISLLSVSLHTWLLQCNQRTPPSKLIWRTKISIKSWHKQNNNNPDYKDADAKQGSTNSYQATSWPSIKCNESKWNFLIPRDDEMVQHISPINKSGPQYIFSL